MVERLSTKVALVTGGLRGIGRAIALELAQGGFDVVINDIETMEGSVDVVHKIRDRGHRSMYLQADISDQDQVNRMIEIILRDLERIDVLVNNAGIVRDKKLENMTLEQWNQVIAVNLTGVFNCTKAVISHMKERGSGKIINIASFVGEIGNFGQANYAASKGGVIAFTKTVAKEYAKYGILVNAIAPGFINTRMVAGIPEQVLQKLLEQIPLKRLGEPEEVAKLVRFLASEDGNYITGQVININGGLYM